MFTAHRKFSNGSNNLAERSDKTRAPSPQNKTATKSLWHGLATNTSDPSSPIQRKCNKCESENTPIQAKLNIGAIDDSFEREADQVSEQVMRMPVEEQEEASASNSGTFKSNASMIRRTCAECEDNEPLQNQTTGNTATNYTSSTPTSVEQVVQSPSTGSPLNDNVRSRIEPVLGADLSSVRVHNDTHAQQAASDINAKAFTNKNNVYLGKGQSSNDVGLMAHEATHTVQQKSTGNVIRRKGLQSELDAELAAWAKTNGHSLDPSNLEYAFTLQEYAYGLARDGNKVHPTQKPKKKSERKKWEKKFKKIALLGKMIMKAGKVDQKESRAGMIGNDLAQVGFIDEAMETAALLSKKDNKASIYKLVLRNASKAKKEHLVTVSNFFTKVKGINDNPVIEKLDGNQGSFAKALGFEKLKAIVNILVDAYKSENKLITILSEILVFNAKLRKDFSKWMWTKDKDFLFKVVDSEFFVEPGYGGGVFQDSEGDAHELSMKKDMPWVYSVKQKYYVDYLVGLGVKAKVKIPKPKNLKFKTLRAWLDKNTEKIGDALGKLYPKKPEEITAAYRQIADIFFFHVDRGDVKPDLKGKLGKLGASKPDNKRLKSDCDVLATFATRFLKSSGFTPIGYMAIIPDKGVGHAVALLQKGADYYIVNNKEISKVSAKDKAAAIVKLRNDGLTVWGNLASYKIYYADAAVDGAMLKSLRDTEESTRRKNLEP